MSIKRQATTELNHDNWDQDDPADHEEMGSFKTASKDEMEKRVIRTAKRRFHKPDSSDVNKPVFSGFGGFNKPAPSSFDFLANLTNGSKTNGNPSPNKNEESTTTGLFSSKPLASSTFQMPVSSPSTVTSTGFGKPSQSKSLFGSSTNNASSLFTSTKADSTVNDSLFKSPTSSTTAAIPTGFNFKASTAASNASTPKATSIFGATPATASTNTLFTLSNNSESKEEKNKLSEATFPVKSPEKTESITGDSKDDPNKLQFYSKLKSLNESVLEWINKHVKETPLCILTPIFNDYSKHLKEIQDEYEKSKESKKSSDTSSSLKKPESASTGSSLFSAKSPTSNAGSLFSNFKADSSPTSQNKPLSGFSFGTNTGTTTSSPSTTGFSFGINKIASESKPSESKPTETAAAPFSFGIGEKFNFSPQTAANNEKSEDKDENEDNDEPPKVEYTPVVEENSVFDKKCKVFVKKGESYADKGVGTLYLKKLESGKHQLLVRANTTLGNVILNFILSSDIPTQRMGKNNVMFVCIPTPDTAPPPVPVLIRVKTSEEADELLETLNKYKA